MAESCERGVTVCSVARRHGLTPQQLFTWRRLAPKARLLGLTLLKKPGPTWIRRWLFWRPAPIYGSCLLTDMPRRMDGMKLAAAVRDRRHPSKSSCLAISALSIVTCLPGRNLSRSRRAVVAAYENQLAWIVFVTCQMG
ncbi:transposase [Rhizobium sp. BK619]|uniref:transposase n=1 Tax=Rhizobium sp. BK619 TaxID=2586989 RepID=UPI0032B2D9F4